MKIKNFTKIVSFDLETTGFSAKNDKVVEFGAIVLEDGKEPLEINHLVDPGIPIPNSHIHGITDEMVKENGISYEEYIKLIKELFVPNEDTLFVAYNIQFDMDFILNEVKSDVDFTKFNLLDVMAIYRDRHSYPHKLDNLVATYNVEVPNTHRALDDIQATLEGLRKMQEEKDNVDIYVNRIGYIAKYGVKGVKLPQVTYVSQYFNGVGEIEREVASKVEYSDVKEYVLSTKGLDGEKRYYASDERIQGLNKPVLFSRGLFKLMCLQEAEDIKNKVSKAYNIQNKEKAERRKNLKIERVTFKESA